MHNEEISPIWKEVLYEKYPELYGNDAYRKMLLEWSDGLPWTKGKSEDQIWAELRKWNHPRFNFRFESGWVNLFRIASDAIRFFSRGQSVTVFQAKQKLGGLRIYVHHDDKECDARIQHALHCVEELSFVICEACGEIGELRDIGGYLQVLCDSHFAERVKECTTRKHKD